MPRQLALIVFVGLILWLFLRDRRQKTDVSIAIWIPLLWIVILGSRPISTWFGIDVTMQSTDNYLEGSPFDRLVFQSLIVAGIIVLWQRRIDWHGIAANNKWVVIYFLFMGISVLWSDYPFTSLKRWVKDVGTLVMVLVVLSERDPIDAVKCLLVRWSYVVIPVSVLFVKYLPNLGRYYDRWTGQPNYGGITTDKNMLGMVLFVSAVFLLWALVDLRDRDRKAKKAEQLTYLILLLMVSWLLMKARSSTALACTLLGAGIIIGTRYPVFRNSLNRIGIYGSAAVILLLLLQATVNLGEVFLALLGRDLTLTGRTEIWAAVLGENTNPLIGTGFYSFWLGDRVERLSESYHFHLNEAHNGYLETYLNTGWIGLFMLFGVLVSAFRRIRQQVVTGVSFAALRMAVLVGTAAYGFTEAVFSRLCPIWFVVLLLIVEYPHRRKVVSDESDADQQVYLDSLLLVAGSRSPQQPSYQRVQQTVDL